MAIMHNIPISMDELISLCMLLQSFVSIYPEMCYVIVPIVVGLIIIATISVLNIPFSYIFLSICCCFLSHLAILKGFFVLIFGQVCCDKEQFPQDPDDKLIICLPHG